MSLSLFHTRHVLKYDVSLCHVLYHAICTEKQWLCTQNNGSALKNNDSALRNNGSANPNGDRFTKTTTTNRYLPLKLSKIRKKSLLLPENTFSCPKVYPFCISLVFKQDHKGPVKLIKRVKIAQSFLQSVSDLFHIIILSLLM